MAKTQRQLELEEIARKRMGATQQPESEPVAEGVATPPRPIVEPRERRTTVGALQNIPESAAQYGENLISIAKDPEKFAEAMKMLFTSEGLGQLKDYYADTYGSTYNAMRKAYNDPVGFMSDLSVIGAPVNILGKTAGLASKTVGKGISQVGRTLEAADPAAAAFAATKTAVANVPGVSGFPERTYETNLKMGTAPTSKYSDPKVRERVVETLLREQVPVSPEGLDKLNKVISGRTKELDALIDVAESEGRRIPIGEILKPLQALRREIGDPRTNPMAAQQIAQIDNYVESWMEQLGPVSELTPKQARSLRQNLDRQIRWGKQDATTPPMQRQITEEMASGAREQLRSTVEGYGETGMDISRLLEAEEPLRRASSRMGQNQTIGLRQAIGMGAGASVGAGGDAFNQILGVMMAGGAAIMTPQNKERLARLIYRSRDMTADQKRTLLGYIGTQSGPMVERMEEGAQQ